MYSPLPGLDMPGIYPSGHPYDTISLNLSPYSILFITVITAS